MDWVVIKIKLNLLLLHRNPFKNINFFIYYLNTSLKFILFFLIFSKIKYSVLSLKGVFPTIHLYIIHPRAHKSHSGPINSSFNISGETYSAVPTNVFLFCLLPRLKNSSSSSEQFSKLSEKF